MPAYCLFDVRSIHDPAAMARYREAVMPTVQAYGGRYLALSDSMDVLEGQWRPGVAVIIEFPCLESARSWYQSPSYEPLKAMRIAGAQCNAVLIGGFCDESVPTSDGQVSRRAAHVYDEFFLPALFAPWAEPMCNAAALQAGDQVLDVACGTGVLSIAAAKVVGARGGVVGLDRNEGMLAVASEKAPELIWRLGVAESLPFTDSKFDAVVSQFGMMFFDDRRRAIEQMWRVLRPGGRLAVAVFTNLDQAPGYAALEALLARLFGQRIADALGAPYSLGDRTQLGSLFAEAGIESAAITTHQGEAAFTSIESWIHTEIKGWTLADALDEDAYERLQREAHTALARFQQPDGSVRFAHPAHIVTATKPQ